MPPACDSQPFGVHAPSLEKKKKVLNSLVIWFLPCSPNQIQGRPSSALLDLTVVLSHISPCLLVFLLARGYFHVQTGRPGYSQQLHKKTPWKWWKWHEHLKRYAAMDVIPPIQVTSAGVCFWGSKMAGSQVGGDPCPLLTPTRLLRFSLQSSRDKWFWYLWGDLFFVLCVPFCLVSHECHGPWAQAAAAVGPCSSLPTT